MSVSVERVAAILLAIVIAACGTTAPCKADASKKSATVRVGLEMTELAGLATAHGLPACEVGSFAPDGRKFVVVLRRGDMEHNWNRYTMLLWRTETLGYAKPEDLLQMNSSSASPAIDPDTIEWGPDGKSLTFLGEQPRGKTQAFRLYINTRRLQNLTSSGTDVISYSVDENGDALAYEVLRPVESLWDAKTARHGLIVTSQSLPEVMTGEVNRWTSAKLLIARGGHIQEVSPMAGSTFLGGDAEVGGRNISISPNGRYVIALETVPPEAVPAEWHDYQDRFLRLTLSINGKTEGLVGFSDLARYVLTDLQTGNSKVLLNSPVVDWLGQRPIWAPNSSSVILSDVLLPMDVKGAREAGRITLEIGVGTGAVAWVDRRCRVALSWRNERLVCSAVPNALEMVTAPHDGQPGACTLPEELEFRKADARWKNIGVQEPPRFRILLKEALNSPPKLYYQARGQKDLRFLWDLNPQFKDVRLATERLISWRWTKGGSITGGLYYPVDYQHGQRYPLVIQTHAFDPHVFSYFGGYSTANAAQPLAARNIFVLQLNDIGIGSDSSLPDKHEERWEVERAMNIYRSAIAHLTQMGLVDPKRVGVIGFSHTCFFVDWAITHDPELFSAASVTEGGDGGYTEYMLNYQNSVETSTLYSGPPFGQHLKSWIDLSPGFNMDRMRTPLLIGVSHHEGALAEWEWLDGLRDLAKPVYMVVLDGRSNDSHLLREPWNRLVSSGNSVDWFDFWLNGHEDRDPAKARQYALWKQLRAEHHRELSNQTVSWSSVERARFHTPNSP